MSKIEQLKNLPAVDEVLRLDVLAELSSRYPRTQLVGWVRDAIDDCRTRILGGNELTQPSLIQDVVARVRKLAQSDAGRSIQRVINATGVLLHTNLGRAPLAQRAIERMPPDAKEVNVVR